VSEEPRSDQSAEFERQAEESQPGILVEFVHFLRYNKKWWLIPILVTLALLGVLVFLSSTTALPWIYAIF
jgi:Family of unknown function (DUF5989)